MTKIKENKILKSVLAFLNLKDTSDVDELIKKKNEFSNDDSFGLMWIVFYLIKNKESTLLGSTEDEEILVRQWLDYASVYLVHISTYLLNDINSILNELNDTLSDRVYVIGNKLSVADLVFYYSLYPVMSKLSMLEKEKYVHISRWFVYIQRDERIRQSKPSLIFSRNLLYR